MALLTKILGDANAREIKKLAFEVEKTNALEPEFKRLSDEDLRKKTEEFRSRLRPPPADSGGQVRIEKEALDELLPEAFAAVREAAKRTLKQRHFDVQLMGGMVLHQGKIAEMKTGEGKTLAATLPLYLNALSQKGAHVVTVNDYLARRDVVWMGQIYHALGMSVGCINHDTSYLYDPAYKKKESNGGEEERDEERDIAGSFRVEQSYLRPVQRREAYAADITYGTNNEFGFDYLRDNMVLRQEDMVQRGFSYAIVDEVDSILIDEARTPLIISVPDAESTKLYDQFARVIPHLKENEDFNIDEKMRAVTLTDEGVVKAERLLSMPDLFTDAGIRYVHHLEQALRSHTLFKRDRDYVVRNGEVIIVDEFTGRLMPGRRFSEGLHQALEAKEGVRVQQESRTLATITFQNYFRMYEKLAGMTGTAVTNAEEFHKVYGLDVVMIPTHKAMIRKDVPDVVFKTENGKFQAVVREIQERHAQGQPALVGTVSIAKNERLSALLSREGISHQLLNAKHHEQEAAIIAQAGRLGAVTVATNMAGRGVDIILGGNPPDLNEAKKVRDVGGLYVIGTDRHEARRIDNQLRGRSGRQGDPGSSRFFVSLEDDLLRIFGGDRIKSLMERLGIPEDQPIENRLIANAIESAQGRIEGYNFDLRKHVLEYDDVMNKHREVIYRERRELLEGQKSAQEEMKQFTLQEVEDAALFHTAGEYVDDWNMEELSESLRAWVPLSETTHQMLDGMQKQGGRPEVLRAQILEKLKELVSNAYHEREIAVGAISMREIEQVVLLRTIDALWMDHLETMEALRDSVRLRAYGQQDPLVEYKNEAHRLFQNLLKLIRSQAVRTIFRVQVAQERRPGPSFGGVWSGTAPQGGLPSAAQRQLPENLKPGHGRGEAPSGQPSGRVGRNDPCPCGALKPDGRPVKWKHCHGKSA